MEIKTQNRKAQITEVAQRLFKEKGYSATSMRDLAKEVGIEPASLYNHIPSKEAILHEICFRIAQEFFDSVEDVMYMNGDSEVKFREAIRRHVQVIVNNMEASQVFFTEWKFLGDEDLNKFKSLRINYEWKFREILQEGMNSGQFKNYDVKIAIFTIFSALNATYDLYKPTLHYSPDEIAEKIGDILLRGLKR